MLDHQIPLQMEMTGGQPRPEILAIQAVQVLSHID